jgi:hypothetical protein
MFNLNISANEINQQVQRGYYLALPFLHTYTPYSRQLTLANKGLNTATKVAVVTQKSFFGKELFQAGLATLSLTASVLRWSPALTFISIVEVLTSIHNIIYYIKHRQHLRAQQQILSLVASLFTLMTLLCRFSYLLCFAKMIRIGLTIFQTGQDAANRRFPEAVAKGAMSMIRIQQLRLF